MHSSVYSANIINLLAGATQRKPTPGCHGTLALVVDDLALVTHMTSLVLVSPCPEAAPAIAPALAQLKLQRLDLHDCKLTDDGVAALAGCAAGLARLECVRLACGDLTDAGRRAARALLLALAALTRLDLGADAGQLGMLELLWQDVQQMDTLTCEKSLIPCLEDKGGTSRSTHSLSTARCN